MGMGEKGMISIPDFPCVYLQSGMKKYVGSTSKSIIRSPQNQESDQL
jgi:hypothetical protein